MAKNPLLIGLQPHLAAFWLCMENNTSFFLTALSMDGLLGRVRLCPC